MSHWRAPEATGSYQLELPEVGLLDFHCSGGGIDLLADDADDRSFPGHPLASASLPFIRVRQWGSDFVLAERYGSAVYCLSVQDRELYELLRLHRKADADTGFMFIEFGETQTLEDLLVFYEQGMARVCAPRNVLWHTRHHRMDYRFQFLRDDVIHVADGLGAPVLYRLSDGQRV